MTAAAKTIYEGRTYGDDHVLRCLPPGLPRIFGSPYPMQVVDAGSHYLMVFMQDNTPRRIWMDGRTPPAEQPLTSMGFSTGKWEGRTLVIETTLLLPGWLDGSGYPMSGGADTRIVERWTPAADGLTMERTHDGPRQALHAADRAHARLAARRRDGRLDRERAVRRAAVLERAARARRARRAPASRNRLSRTRSYLRASPRTRAAGYFCSFSAILSSAACSEIDAELVGHPQQIDEYVGELEPHALAPLAVQLRLCSSVSH